MKRICLLLPILLLASACEMIVPPWQLSKLHREAKQPMTCMAGADCRQKWARAQEWVKKNSRVAVVTQTDTLIQTADSPSASPEPDFTITLVPAGEGNYRIIFKSGCSDLFGCIPPVLKLKASFTRYVTGASSDPVFPR